MTQDSHKQDLEIDQTKRQLFFGKRGQDAIDVNVDADLPKTIALSDACLAHQGVSCRACEDACLEDAIFFRPQLGGKELPIIDHDNCTACSECIPICPTTALSLVEVK